MYKIVDLTENQRKIIFSVKNVQIKNVGPKLKTSLGSYEKFGLFKGFLTLLSHFLMDLSRTFRITICGRNITLIKILWCMTEVLFRLEYKNWHAAVRNLNMYRLHHQLELLNRFCSSFRLKLFKV
jgi:hypothetical protein